jgi:hypothetical protein
MTLGFGMPAKRRRLLTPIRRAALMSALRIGAGIKGEPPLNSHCLVAS